MVIRFSSVAVKLRACYSTVRYAPTDSTVARLDRSFSLAIELRGVRTETVERENTALRARLSINHSQPAGESILAISYILRPHEVHMYIDICERPPHFPPFTCPYVCSKVGAARPDRQDQTVGVVMLGVHA